MKNILILIQAIVLSLGFMFLFFGGTWDGVRFGLEILGGIFIIQTVYKQLTEDKENKKEQEKLKEATKKYFD